VRINYHEHAFQVSKLLVGDELDNIEKSIKEFKDLYDSGFEGYIDATPLFLGRNIEGLIKLIEQTKLMVFPVTGFHHSGHYELALQEKIMSKGVSFWVEKINSEINLGMVHNEDSFLNEGKLNYSYIKAKVLKIGLRNAYSEFEVFTLNVLKNVYASNPIAIKVHLDGDCNQLEVSDRLIDLGISPNRTVLAHVDRNINYDVFAKLTEKGFFLGFDSFVRSSELEIIRIYEAITRFPNHVLIGGDLARSSRYLAYGGTPGLKFVAETIIEKVRGISGEDILNRVLVENPKRWLNSGI
jgi:predicted metal-dependent phosphotriesterase family hydrolase